MLTKQQKRLHVSTKLMLLTLLILSGGCAQKSTALKPCPPLMVPALSQSAQMPPQIESCLPSCSEYLTAEREYMLKKLTDSELH